MAYGDGDTSDGPAFPGGDGGRAEDADTAQIWSAVSRLAQLTLLGAGASGNAAAVDEWEGGRAFDEEAAFRVAL